MLQQYMYGAHCPDSDEHASVFRRSETASERTGVAQPGSVRCPRLTAQL